MVQAPPQQSGGQEENALRKQALEQRAQILKMKERALSAAGNPGDVQREQLDKVFKAADPEVGAALATTITHYTDKPVDQVDARGKDPMDVWVGRNQRIVKSALDQVNLATMDARFDRKTTSPGGNHTEIPVDRKPLTLEMVAQIKLSDREATDAVNNPWTAEAARGLRERHPEAIEADKRRQPKQK